jgi:hypothetical protein
VTQCLGVIIGDRVQELPHFPHQRPVSRAAGHGSRSTDLQHCWPWRAYAQVVFSCKVPNCLQNAHVFRVRSADHMLLWLLLL